MIEQTTDDSYARKFHVISIEKSVPPEGVAEGEWYHYVIGGGSSQIMGKRSGTLKSVTDHVEEFVGNLNQRTTLGYSPNAARKPVPKKIIPNNLSSDSQSKVS
ncbi:MAG: hypothetical protein GY763_00705 [Gammaproteobacteria bacterium]|nr:hypothetical protein [Gammaproteobacteria bacterium]